MYQNKFIFIAFIFLFASKSVFASIRDLVESTFTASNMYAGGASSNFLFPVSSSISNAALLGALERKAGGGMGYAFMNPIDLIWAQVYLPSPVGAISVNGGFLQNKEVLTQALTERTLDFDRYYFVSLGYGRQFTKRFSFGLYLKTSTGRVFTRAFLALSAEPGFFYNTKINLSTKSGFGLYDLSFYLLSHNLGANIIDDFKLGPRISVHTGTQFLFFNKYDFKAGMNGEVIGVGDYKSFPLRFGLQLQYKFFNIGAGYALGKENDLFHGLTLGGGLNFGSEKAGFSANYSLLSPKSSGKEAFHSLFLRISIGKIDKIPPDVEVEQDIGDFSPNWDGEKDYINFELDADDESLIKAWSFSIKNINGKTIRRFASDPKEFEPDFGLKDFFKYFFMRQPYLSVPSSIRWNGESAPLMLEQTAFIDNKPLPDGVYSYSFVVTDEKGNKNKPLKGFMRIDTTSPQIEVNTPLSAFSPNGGGFLKKLTITQKFNASNRDSWQAGFIDSEGDVVKSYQWKGRDVPSQVIWNGTDDKGRPAPEGLYTYFVKGSDTAGNTSNRQIQQIALTRRKSAIDFRLSSKGLSPNNDGVMDTISITPKLSNIALNKGEIIGWKIIVTKEPAEKRGRNTRALMEWKGASRFPDEIRWNGTGLDQASLEDGEYYIQLSIQYRNRNRIGSFPKKVVIDTQPPRVDIDTSDKDVFSPDDDGLNDELTFSLSVEDESPVAEYEFYVIEIGSDRKGNPRAIPFKQFKGTGKCPKKLFWHGKSDRGNLVESATEYKYKLKVIDQYGNIGKSSVGKFETDLLVLPKEENLRVRISNVKLSSSKEAFQEKTKKLLENFSSLLDKYSNYSVKIEAHTDDLGEEDSNLRRSENSAKAVMDHLIDLGIDADRMSYQGVGEIVPLLPNSNWYNRSRNRRFEFILQRESDIL